MVTHTVPCSGWLWTIAEFLLELDTASAAVACLVADAELGPVEH